jgi:YVTN family beta-propeller protein
MTAVCVLAYQRIATHPPASVALDYHPNRYSGKQWPSHVARTIEGLQAPYRLTALPSRVDGVSYVYVADRDAGSVAVINTKTDTIVNTVACGSAGPPVAVAPSQRGDEVLVGMAGATGGGLGLIEPLATWRPVSLAVSAQCLTFSRHDVFIFDCASCQLLCLPRIALAAGAAPRAAGLDLGDQCLDMALTPDEEHLFVGLRDSRRVGLLRVASLSDPKALASGGPGITQGCSVPGQPCGLSMDGIGTRLFVSLLDGGVACLDLQHGAVSEIATGAGQPGCRWMAMTPRGEYLYVADYADGSVAVIDVARQRAVDLISVGKGPSDVAVTLDYKVYVANTDEGTVSVIE